MVRQKEWGEEGGGKEHRRSEGEVVSIELACINSLQWISFATCADMRDSSRCVVYVIIVYSVLHKLVF